MRAALVQQGHDMLAKELFDLKPGTFIKGFQLLNMSRIEGRSVTFNSQGWKCDDLDILIESEYKDYVVRTPWYNNPTFKPCNGLKAFEISNSFAPFICGEDAALENDFFEDGAGDNFGSMGWANFRYNEPIGIHLGTFGVFMSQAQGDAGWVTIYTKILRGDGEVGYLVCATNNLNLNHLELL